MSTSADIRSIAAGVPKDVAAQVHTQAPAEPTLDRENKCIHWAGLIIGIVQPRACPRCTVTSMQPRVLGRYGPVAVLDAAAAHVVVRGDMTCKSCKKKAYCSSDDVKQHFQSRGVHAVIARTRTKEAATHKCGVPGSGRKCVWHTAPFIATLYSSLRQERALESLKAAFATNLVTCAMQSDGPNPHGSAAMAYKLSFVPASATLGRLVRNFHCYQVKPQVFKVRKTTALRTKVYKVDGHRKAAKLVRGLVTGVGQTAILPVMNEEGCLVGPPRLVRGEGRQGFEEGLHDDLDIHMEVNASSADSGALVRLVKSGSSDGG